MGNGHSGHPASNRMTDTCENITFLQLRRQAVIILLRNETQALTHQLHVKEAVMKTPVPSI